MGRIGGSWRIESASRQVLAQSGRGSSWDFEMPAPPCKHLDARCGVRMSGLALCHYRYPSPRRSGPPRPGSTPRGSARARDCANSRQVRIIALEFERLSLEFDTIRNFSEGNLTCLRQLPSSPFLPSPAFRPARTSTPTANAPLSAQALPVAQLPCPVLTTVTPQLQRSPVQRPVPCFATSPAAKTRSFRTRGSKTTFDRRRGQTPAAVFRLKGPV